MRQLYRRRRRRRRRCRNNERRVGRRGKGGGRIGCGEESIEGENSHVVIETTIWCTSTTELGCVSVLHHSFPLAFSGPGFDSRSGSSIIFVS